MATSKKSAAKKSAPKKNAATQPGTPEPLLVAFFCDEIKDIYWAEKKLVTTLPKMAKAATSKELKKAFLDHLAITKGQIVRLEKVFKLLGKKAQGKKCEAMAGIVKEGESIISDTEKGTSTRDVGLILAAQKVEHYEISTYGGLTELAKSLRMNDVAEILFKTLMEEKEADMALTGIAEKSINYMAAEEVK